MFIFIWVVVGIFYRRLVGVVCTEYCIAQSEETLLFEHEHNTFKVDAADAVVRIHWINIGSLFLSANDASRWFSNISRSANVSVLR